MSIFSSLRTRTTLVAMLVTAVALAAVGVTLVKVLRDSLIDEIDRSLQARIAFIDSQLDNPRARGVILDSVRRREIGRDTLELLISNKGLILVGSDFSGNARREILEARPGGKEPFTADLSSFERTEGSERMRVVVIADEPEIPSLGKIVTATSLRGVDETVDEVRTVILIAGPALVALVGLLVWLLVGRAVKPVEEIRREADRITGSDLSRRLPLPRRRDEIAALTATVNSMLDRLDEAQRDQQRFIADASHELRTPLAGILAQLDVSLAHPGETEWQPIARNLREQTDRLQHLLDDLLLMARWGEREERRPRGEQLVDLDVLVLEEAQALGISRPGVIETSGVSGGLVVGDAEELRRMARNLIANALRHARDRIVLGVGEAGGEVTFTVDDDGPGIPRRDRDRVFDRFARLDSGRSAAQGGAGLGLAISREIANRHRGSIAVEDAPGGLGGARFTVTLPAAEPAS